MASRKATYIKLIFVCNEDFTNAATIRAHNNQILEAFFLNTSTANETNKLKNLNCLHFKFKNIGFEHIIERFK